MLVSPKHVSLKDLPPPPPGKRGWPWTDESDSPCPALQGDRMRDNEFAWPKISILTPSYNYGHFIEATIRSVLLQGYPNLEYIIIDGGSVDHTIDIIHKYESHLSFWVSESDNGQTDAINKGVARCTGDIFAWLNADDIYDNNQCLYQVAEYYRQGNQLIAGQCRYINLTSTEISSGFHRKVVSTTFDQYLRHWSCVIFHQPSVFIDKSIVDQCFPLNANLHLSMDYQYFLRALSFHPKSAWLEETLSCAYLHSENKTLAGSSSTLERYQVAMEESAKLNFWKRVLYQADLKDITTLTVLIHQEEFPSCFQVLKVLAKRMTLLRLPLFWKVFLKSILGSGAYSALKLILKLS